MIAIVKIPPEAFTSMAKRIALLTADIAGPPWDQLGEIIFENDAKGHLLQVQVHYQTKDQPNDP
jgi:hypothetical protein